ncbi:hypothetical protein HALA3H3_340106 [Halomonas sp. A3H3]|nr:hypothetical protein HALA3H3_340106 [Halomonas sp. A3H3]
MLTAESFNRRQILPSCHQPDLQIEMGMFISVYKSRHINYLNEYQLNH